ncbi:hypothetical protein JOF53_004748 [Crossiella equi]|uniref:DUF4097 domain-containing protein n=1 Tax=Crossiella equi TaxID=130796 RepID=A0ABS5AH29_9PSEU|nr:DUF4097 family beta strand repeat-containing protein [Crossiella equi]MBP2475876.1 hypothetical protein [Crossiella equi]
MPTFQTPEPITVILNLSAADVRVTASDRTDTVVDVLPVSAAKDRDVQAADSTTVEFSNGVLRVRTPKPRVFGRPGTVSVVLAVPTGTRLEGEAALADLRTEGELGTVRFTTASGDLEVDRAGETELDATAGRVVVGQTTGHTVLTTGSGDIRAGRINGTAVLRNANGSSTVEEVTQDLRYHGANGDLAVGRALSTVGAKTANGSIRLAEVSEGAVNVESAAGDLEIGLRERTAAYIDANTVVGRVHNDLLFGDKPKEDALRQVKIKARTMTGDITIRRAWTVEN